jgi:hypothetical protein
LPCLLCVGEEHVHIEGLQERKKTEIMKEGNRQKEEVENKW